MTTHRTITITAPPRDLDRIAANHKQDPFDQAARAELLRLCAHHSVNPSTAPGWCPDTAATGRSVDEVLQTIAIQYRDELTRLGFSLVEVEVLPHRHISPHTTDDPQNIRRFVQIDAYLRNVRIQTEIANLIVWSVPADARFKFVVCGVFVEPYLATYMQSSMNRAHRKTEDKGFFSPIKSKITKAHRIAARLIDNATSLPKAQIYGNTIIKIESCTEGITHLGSHGIFEEMARELFPPVHIISPTDTWRWYADEQKKIMRAYYNQTPKCTVRTHTDMIKNVSSQPHPEDAKCQAPPLDQYPQRFTREQKSSPQTTSP